MINATIAGGKVLREGRPFITPDAAKTSALAREFSRRFWKRHEDQFRR